MKLEQNTHAITDVWDKLPPIARQELIDFTEFLAMKYLAKPDPATAHAEMAQFNDLISKMAGSATSSLTTDEIMELTRGE